MGNVYFITNKSAIKIGYSEDINRRIKQLQTGNEEILELLNIIENVDLNFEKHIHSVCKAYHIGGEWFHIQVLDFLLNKTSPWFKENMKEK